MGQTTADGLAQVRALGIEQGSILNQWRVPREYIGEIKQNAGVTSIGVVGDLDRATSCPIISVAGRKGTITTGIKPNYADVKNKRVLYGTYNKYGIMTTAGNSGEFRPEEITTESEAPEVSYIADPRADGKPYFRFTTVNGNTDFWYNFVAGSRWQNVPLVYQGASGSALTRLNFDNMRASERLEFEQNTVNARLSQAGNIGDALANLGMMAAAASGAGALGSQAGSLTASQSIQMGQYMQQGSQAGGGIVSSLLNVLGTEYKLQQYTARYKQDKANELSQLYQNTTIYTPTVNFPYNADILRDVKGNSVLIYKYRLQDLDVKRIDKLLTMYGYKEAEPLTADNFNRRTHFDYIECSSVTVTGKPRWWNDGIAAQLRNGVRIWHELPNVAAYDDNPVRSTT